MFLGNNNCAERELETNLQSGIQLGFEPKTL